MFEGHAASRLGELATGDEHVWDYVPLYLADHAVSRESALAALQSCLGVKIPIYRQVAQTGHEYWQKRLEEAEAAQRVIPNGKPVTYRTITV